MISCWSTQRKTLGGKWENQGFLNPGILQELGFEPQSSASSATRLSLGWPELPPNLIPEEIDFHEPLSPLPQAHLHKAEKSFFPLHP